VFLSYSSALIELYHSAGFDKTTLRQNASDLESFLMYAVYKALAEALSLGPRAREPPLELCMNHSHT
jgi:hypothetical protein